MEESLQSNSLIDNGIKAILELRYEKEKYQEKRRELEKLNEYTSDGTSKIDSTSPTPIYMQIADVLALRISEGKYLTRKLIPSESILEMEFRVARATIRHAISELRKRNLVFTIPQRGTFVK